MTSYVSAWALRALTAIGGTASNDIAARDRALQRYQRSALTTASSVAAKALSLLASAISIPLTIGYLGVERYGMWMTIDSVVAMLAFADLGVSPSLISLVSEANGKEDLELAQNQISSALVVLSVVALFLAVPFGIAYPHVEWARLFNVSSSRAAVEAGPAVAVLVACFATNLPLSAVRSVHWGYQEGFINDLWQALGGLVGLAGILVAISVRAGLPWFVLAIAGGHGLSLMLNSIAAFGLQRPALRPKWHCVTVRAIKRIFDLSLFFVVLQIAMAVAYLSDNIVAARVLGPAAVTQYSVPRTLFGIPLMVVTMVVNPLWPAYTEAIARGDALWVKATLKATLGIAILFSALPSALLVALGPKIMRLWVGSAVKPSFGLLLGFGVWTILAAAGTTIAIFLNAASILRFQVISASLMAASALLAKIILARQIGISGIIWGTIIAYTVFTVIPLAVYLPKFLNRLEPASREHLDQAPAEPRHTYAGG